MWRLEYDGSRLAKFLKAFHVGEDKIISIPRQTSFETAVDEPSRFANHPDSRVDFSPSLLFFVRRHRSESCVPSALGGTSRLRSLRLLLSVLLLEQDEHVGWLILDEMNDFGRRPDVVG